MQLDIVKNQRVIMAALKPAPLSTFAKLPAASPSVEVLAVSGDQPVDKLRQKVFRVTPVQDRKIKEFCAHSDMTVQGLVMEGINLALKAKGLPPI